MGDLLEQINSIGGLMRACPPFQHFIEDLAAAHDIDVRFNGARLVLEVECLGVLEVQNTSPNSLSLVQRFDYDIGVVETPTVILFTGSPQWLPTALLCDDDSFRAADISDDGCAVECLSANAQLEVVVTCEKWTTALRSGGWTRDAVVIERERGDEVHAENIVIRLLDQLGIAVEEAR